MEDRPIEIMNPKLLFEQISDPCKTRYAIRNTREEDLLFDTIDLGRFADDDALSELRSRFSIHNGDFNPSEMTLFDPSKILAGAEILDPALYFGASFALMVELLEVVEDKQDERE